MMRPVSMSQALTHATAPWDTLAGTATQPTVHLASVSTVERVLLATMEDGRVNVPSSILVCQHFCHCCIVVCIVPSQLQSLFGLLLMKFI